MYLTHIPYYKCNYYYYYYYYYYYRYRHRDCCAAVANRSDQFVGYLNPDWFVQLLHALV